MHSSLHPVLADARRMGAIWLLCALVALTLSCRSSTSLNEQELSQVNCQQSDFPKRFTPRPATSKVPDDAWLLGQIVNYHHVLFEDISLTYQTFSCQIIVYENISAAQQAFDMACESAQPPPTAPEVGDAACTFGEGVVTLNFRQGPALVILKADLYGAGVERMAINIAKRLKP